MARRRKPLLAVTLAGVAAVLAACGSQGLELGSSGKADATLERGAHLFAERCSGCHTLKAAGAEGSATTLKNRERVDGPNFDQRKEKFDQVLFAIRNGGFSGAIMPQNIVVGRDAQAVARFVEKYAGRDAGSQSG